MIADQKFLDIFFMFFILRLRLRPTAEGRSLSGPNIRLRPKVKIAPTVQHCLFGGNEDKKKFYWYSLTFKEAISEEIVINIKPSLPEIILSDEVTYETKIVEPGL